MHFLLEGTRKFKGLDTQGDKGKRTDKIQFFQMVFVNYGDITLSFVSSHNETFCADTFLSLSRRLLHLRCLYYDQSCFGTYLGAVKCIHNKQV